MRFARKRSMKNVTTLECARPQHSRIDTIHIGRDIHVVLCYFNVQYTK